MIKLWWPWYQSLTVYNIWIAQKWYIKYYTTQILNKLDSQIVYDEFVKLDNGLLVVICCECEQQESSFCHRHLIAKWLESNISGFVISYKSIFFIVRVFTDKLSVVFYGMFGGHFD